MRNKMMNYKLGLTFIVLFALLGATPALMAQGSNDAPSRKITDYKFGKFTDNWFISAGFGGNLYYGDDDYRGAFGDRLTPALDISIGKWLSPVWGARLQYNGLQMKGFGWSKFDPYVTKIGTGLQPEKFNYISLHGDVLFNISAAIAGYNPNRVYELIPYAGMGFANSSGKNIKNNKNYHRTNYIFFLGVINKFRIANAWDANLELRAGATKDELDGTWRGVKADFPLSATVGFTYYIGGKNYKGFKQATNFVDNSNELDLLRQQLANAKEKATGLEKENDALRNRKPEVVVETEYVAAAAPVFFDLNSRKITPEAINGLEAIAKIIKESNGKTFSIIGYADSATGKPEYNQKLSTARAKAVCDVLVKKFGVPASQVKAIGRGGVPNVFDQNEYSRTVIVKAD
ncbi:MAG: OmpA family protein [Bacteroidales bacterium]